jgi:putative membrane protein
MLTADDRARIEAAVAEAEAGTSGDIFCVLAGEVSHYREVPLAWGAAAALVIPPIVAALALRPLQAALTGGWTAAHASAAGAQVAMALSGYAIGQIVLFAAVTLLASVPVVRRRLTPRFLKRHRVRQAAFHHYAAAHSHSHQDSDTGVVIFIALVERQVEILADKAIHDRVGDDVWNRAAAAVGEGMREPDPTAGIIQAIGICGEALKAHFPASGPRARPDRPVEC